MITEARSPQEIVGQLERLGASCTIEPSYISAVGVPLPLLWQIKHLPTEESRIRTNLRDLGYLHPDRNLDIDPQTQDQRIASEVLCGDYPPSTSPQYEPIITAWIPETTGDESLALSVATDTTSEKTDSRELFTPDALKIPQGPVEEVLVLPHLLVLNGLHRHQNLHFLNREVRGLHAEVRIGLMDFFGAITTMIKATSDKGELSIPRHYLMYKALWQQTGPKELVEAGVSVLDALNFVSGNQNYMQTALKKLAAGEEVHGTPLIDAQEELREWAIRAHAACDLTSRPDTDHLSQLDRAMPEQVNVQAMKGWARKRSDDFRGLDYLTDAEISILRTYRIQGRGPDDLPPPKDKGFVTPSDIRIIASAGLEPALGRRVVEQIKKSPQRLSRRALERHVAEIAAASDDPERQESLLNDTTRTVTTRFKREERQRRAEPPSATDTIASLEPTIIRWANGYTEPTTEDLDSLNRLVEAMARIPGVDVQPSPRPAEAALEPAIQESADHTATHETIEKLLGALSSGNPEAIRALDLPPHIIEQALTVATPQEQAATNQPEQIDASEILEQLLWNFNNLTSDGLDDMGLTDTQKELIEKAVAGIREREAALRQEITNLGTRKSKESKVGDLAAGKLAQEIVRHLDPQVCSLLCMQYLNKGDTSLGLALSGLPPLPDSYIGPIRHQLANDPRRVKPEFAERISVIRTYLENSQTKNEQDRLPPHRRTIG